MGTYLEKPVTEITTEEGTGPFFEYAAATMQGWRMTQEDAHNCLPAYDTVRRLAYFAVYDGHGGPEVAQYCKEELPKHIFHSSLYQKGRYEQALKQGFLTFDATLHEEEAVTRLYEISGRHRIDCTEESPEEFSDLFKEAQMPLNEVLAKYRMQANSHEGSSHTGEGSSGSSSQSSSWTTGTAGSSHGAKSQQIIHMEVSPDATTPREEEMPATADACATAAEPESASTCPKLKPKAEENSKVQDSCEDNMIPCNKDENVKEEQISSQKKCEVNAMSICEESEHKKEVSTTQQPSGDNAMSICEESENKKEENATQHQNEDNAMSICEESEHKKDESTTHQPCEDQTITTSCELEPKEKSSNKQPCKTTIITTSCEPEPTMEVDTTEQSCENESVCIESKQTKEDNSTAEQLCRDETTTTPCPESTTKEQETSSTSTTKEQETSSTSTTKEQETSSTSKQSSDDQAITSSCEAEPAKEVDTIQKPHENESQAAKEEKCTGEDQVTKSNAESEASTEEENSTTLQICEDPSSSSSLQSEATKDEESTAEHRSEDDATKSSVQSEPAKKEKNVSSEIVLDDASNSSSGPICIAKQNGSIPWQDKSSADTRITTVSNRVQSSNVPEPEVICLDDSDSQDTIVLEPTCGSSTEPPKRKGKCNPKTVPPTSQKAQLKPKDRTCKQKAHRVKEDYEDDSSSNSDSDHPEETMNEPSENFLDSPSILRSGDFLRQTYSSDDSESDDDKDYELTANQRDDDEGDEEESEVEESDNSNLEDEEEGASNALNFEEEEEDEKPGVDSGSTAVVALVTASKITVANIGDSRAILGRLDPAGENIRVVELSHDHKPEMPEELERIKRAGGRVDNEGRIDGGLNLSRAFGDFANKNNKDLSPEEQKIIAKPEVVSEDLDLSHQSKGGRHEFLFIACDGIWNVKTSQQVAEFVWDHLKQATPLKSILEKLLNECLAEDNTGDGTGCDNMSAILVRFRQRNTPMREILVQRKHKKITKRTSEDSKESLAKKARTEKQ